MKQRIRLIINVVFACAALGTLQACATASTPGDVASAYQTSGVLPAHPYTRTIFSTHDF